MRNELAALRTTNDLRRMMYDDPRPPLPAEAALCSSSSQAV